MRFVPVAGAAAIVPFAFAAVLFGTAAQAAPSVTLSPTTTHPQGATRVSGTGFGPNEAVDIYLDQTDTLLEVTNGAGAFGPDKITISAFAAVGDHWITAIGRKDGAAAHRKLVVSTAWASYGFDARGRRRNPYEVTLNATNVNRLDLAWSAATGNSILSSPAVAQGTGTYNPSIFVGSFDNHFYAFGSNGALRWSQALPDQVDSSAAVANGVVYVGCQDKNLYAFKTATGAPAWPAPAATGNAIDSSPVVANGIVYVASQDAKLYAFKTSDGSAAWASPAITSGVIRFSSPAVAGGNVYIGSRDDKLYAFKAADGTPAWTSPAATGGIIDSSPAVANGVVYVGSGDDRLYAFNADRGDPVWVSAPTGGAIASSPALFSAAGSLAVYVGSADGKLYAFNANSGALLWTGATGSSITSSPAVANGIVFIGSGDGRVYAFNANGCGGASCSPLWSAATGGSITLSSPAISDGIVYVGSGDHSLYAFALDAGNAVAYRHRNAPPPPYATLHPDFRLKPVKHPMWTR